MKKLKIFLLLCFLVCFGFALNSEVHAESNSPKSFEVGDVLPATTQLKISWSSDDGTAFYSDCDNLVIKTDNNNYRFINYVRNDWEKSGDFGFLGDEYEVIYKVFGGDDINDGFGEWYGTYGVDKFCIIDISALTEAQRTVSFYSNLRYNDYYWEDLNAPEPIDGPKIFEVGDVLPAGNIKISWDFTGKPLSDGESFYIEFIEITQFDRPYDGYFIEIRIPSILNPSASFFIGDTPGGTIITLTEEVPINDIGGSNYYEYIDGAIFWEDVSEEYANGYTDGSASADVNFFTGYERGIEAYGYYDSNTNRWLSVSEYLDLYGTDKPGQSDFYNNFDKYFIPAMIIVFGGAIVITVLKVFKGRE